jgi:hypothetical protein
VGLVHTGFAGTRASPLGNGCYLCEACRSTLPVPKVRWLTHRSSTGTAHPSALGEAMRSCAVERAKPAELRGIMWSRLVAQLPQFGAEASFFVGSTRVRYAESRTDARESRVWCQPTRLRFSTEMRTKEVRVSPAHDGTPVEVPPQVEVPRWRCTPMEVHPGGGARGGTRGGAPRGGAPWRCAPRGGAPVEVPPWRCQSFPAAWRCAPRGGAPVEVPEFSCPRGGARVFLPPWRCAPRGGARVFLRGGGGARVFLRGSRQLHAAPCR